MGNRLLDPATTNIRHQEPENVYHLYNRIAHSVRFLNEEEKDDLLDRVRRIAQFCGLTLLSWCLMTNHFHILVYLPEPKRLSLEEIKERLKLLRPSERALFHEGFILNRSPEEISRRICNIGMYMKIVKENFTLDYNDRTGHKGTMWAGPYNFKKVPMTVKDLSTVAAYQNLNPVRACMVADYTSYRWTSFAAAAKGDAVALEGLRFIYRGLTDLSDRSVNLDVVAEMQAKMDHDLEACRRERAEAVWRRRLAGRMEEHPDPLTTEAQVAQVEERMARIESQELQSALARMLGRRPRESEVRVVRAMAMAPTSRMVDIARATGVGESLVKCISVALQKVGVISRVGSRRKSAWRINLFADN